MVNLIKYKLSLLVVLFLLTIPLYIQAHELIWFTTSAKNNKLEYKETGERIANGLNEFDDSHLACDTTFGSASNNGPICEKSMLQLNADGGVSYSWSGPNGFTSFIKNPSIPNATLLYGGIYTVTVTDVNECTNIRQTNVLIHSEPFTIISSNGPVCVGSTIYLQLSGGKFYEWSGPNGFSSTLQNPKIEAATEANSGMYQVKVTSENLCTKYDTIHIVVGGQLNVVVDSNSPVCEGEELMITTIGGSAFQWSGPDGFTSSMPNPVIPKALRSNMGLYRLAVTDRSSCSAILELNIIVQSKIIANVTGKDSICLGESVILTTSNEQNFHWNTGETSPSIEHMPTSTTTYSIIVSDYICSDSAFATVVVVPPPILTISEPLVIVEGEAVQLQVSGADNYFWMNAEGLDCVDCDKPFANPIESQRYCVQGFSQSCTSEICTEINVQKKCNLELANIFSPNRDNQNDIWCSPKTDCILFQNITIFDRWGNTVWASQGEEVCWDGTIHNQENSGNVFSYILEQLTAKNTKEFHSGTITLIK